jgi:CheY-like chemotaxis protein
VRDTGTGILPDQLEQVFRPFEQVGNSQHRAGGTGLGLSISRQLVQLMGSEIQVESTWGRGSCFSFTLSTRPIVAQKTQTAADGKVVGYNGPRRNLLLVDDIEANRFMMSTLLAGLGFELSLACDGVEALEKAQSRTPDLILTDIRMPRMTGLELMGYLKELPELSQVPVIAVSAGVTAQKQSACMAAGAKAFLTKPIHLPTLFQELGRLLNVTWIREVENQEAAPVHDKIDESAIPEREQLESLHLLAKAGSMRSIREKAAELAALNENYRPFTDRITQLAISFESKALLRLIEKYALQPIEPLK